MAIGCDETMISSSHSFAAGFVAVEREPLCIQTFGCGTAPDAFPVCSRISVRQSAASK